MNRFLKHLPRGVAFAVVGAALGLPLSAGASAHMIAGAQCVFRDGALPTYTTSAGIQNPNASSQVVFCPGEAAVLGSSIDGKAFVNDRRSDAQICCSVRARNANGGLVSTSSDDCSGTATVGNDIELATSSIPVSGTFTYKYVQCSVPAASGGNVSGIGAYRTLEL